MKRIFSIVLVAVLAFNLVPFAAPTILTAYSAGSVVTNWTGTADDLYRYHAHTKGSGIPIFIMPVHFGPGDLAAGGKLQTASKWAADVVLDGAEEFWEDLPDYLDIYVYIQSEAVYPVPTSGYVSSWNEKMNKARQLTKDWIGIDPAKARMVYLGNSDGAGQVGGHAYLYDGAMLSWGKNADGDDWQDNPPYWARHEFFGHGYAGFSDEYEIDLSLYNPLGPNVVESATRPTNGVPWYDFLGFKETFDSVEYEIGINTHNNPDYRWWFPVTSGFMHSSNPYIPMYHKWIIYKLTMDYAGTPKTLADFCTMQGITLNPPPPETAKDALLIDAQKGGAHQLQGDVALTSQFNIENDFTLDLNGYTLTIDVNTPFRSGVQIGAGKTLTVTDGAGGGILAVTCNSGAGINTNGGELVINSGMVDVTGGDWSAGIGGRQGRNGTVIINGGTVTAKGHMNSAGIGGGSGGGGGSIIINGGTVTATGMGPADIGHGAGGDEGVVAITGGSVNATRQSVNPVPTNGSGPVYMVALTLAGMPNTQITMVTSPSRTPSLFNYGSDDMRTDTNGKIYLWLPQGENPVTLTAGGITYTGTVTVAANNSNAVALTPSSDLPPSIGSQPSNLTVTEGRNAVFTVSASGYPVPTYQWQISTNNGGNWMNISGATSNTLTLTNVTIDGHNGNQYRCVITNTTTQLNTVTSNAAKLTVREDFGPNPTTGIPGIKGAVAAMCVFSVLSVALWGYIFLRKRKRNG